MENIEKLTTRLREYADWCDANEYDVPICMGDHQRHAADLIEALQAQLAESRRRERVAETAMEEMTYIIQKAAFRRCDYCIYRMEPCPARGLHAECDFEYAGERGPVAGEGDNNGAK